MELYFGVSLTSHQPISSVVHTTYGGFCNGEFRVKFMGIKLNAALTQIILFLWLLFSRRTIKPASVQIMCNYSKHCYHRIKLPIMVIIIICKKCLNIFSNKLVSVRIRGTIPSKRIEKLNIDQFPFSLNNNHSNRIEMDKWTKKVFSYIYKTHTHSICTKDLSYVKFQTTEQSIHRHFVSSSDTNTGTYAADELCANCGVPLRG